MYGELGLPVDIEKQKCDLQLRREFIRNTLNALAPQAALLVQLQFHYSEYFLFGILQTPEKFHSGLDLCLLQLGDSGAHNLFDIVKQT